MTEGNARISAGDGGRIDKPVTEAAKQPSLAMNQVLTFMVSLKGSDLHLSADAVPRIRVHGDMMPLSMPPLDSGIAKKMIYSILSEEQQKKLEDDKDLDSSYEIPGVSRFRVNVCYQRGRLRATVRTIPAEIKSFQDLKMEAPVFEKICRIPKGMILVTGATGSGKSTTLAAMIDFVNRSRKSHIVTIEDPIEFVHQDKNCMVTQREIGADTRTFASALKHVLRQDPDIVLIGEMRDQETVQVGLELAETGHLTFATLHTADAIQTINRIIDIFPPEQQPQIRTQLGFVLEAVVCQQLLKTRDGKGRVVAQEILIANQSVRANIRSDKIHQIYSTIQTSNQTGMKTMNQSLFELTEKGLIDPETALKNSSRAEELEKMLRELSDFDTMEIETGPDKDQGQGAKPNAEDRKKGTEKHPQPVSGANGGAKAPSPKW
ncbi:MAG: type IV pilus twitching motility protein PilT [Planctomycetota bacterium]|jgi:twitching motility protein PilT|nr:type IV pilus twitching motility protein PilT [Planctomycetota bacterium]